jgi:hypothetical protein
VGVFTMAYPKLAIFVTLEITSERNEQAPVRLIKIEEYS